MIWVYKCFICQKFFFQIMNKRVIKYFTRYSRQTMAFPLLPLWPTLPVIMTRHLHALCVAGTCLAVSICRSIWWYILAQKNLNVICVIMHVSSPMIWRNIKSNIYQTIVLNVLIVILLQKQKFIFLTMFLGNTIPIL